ncbi:hypothetical protein CPB85DRAFT_1274616, partial [Mucidula mucida]
MDALASESDTVHDFSDFQDSSSRSDDGLSDSDWLDIATNRESDDNDSVSSRDSDVHDGVPSLPLSRRSSLGRRHHPWPPRASDPAIDGPILSPVFDLGIDEQEIEERRLRDALDQSMISTLGSSRSGSLPSTVHNSIRDLRLSFPDPLTSSRDELSSSYDNVSSSVQNISPSPEIVDNSPVPESPALGPVSLLPQETAKEPGPIPIPVSSEQGNSLSLQSSYGIKLYGTPSSIKWTFVYQLMQSSCQKKGLNLAAINTSPCGAFHWLQFTNAHGATALTVQVEDHIQRTPSRLATLSASLGIVYLPWSPLPEDFRCDRLLPVPIPDEEKPHDGTVSSSMWFADARRSKKTLVLRKDSTLIAPYHDITELHTSMVHETLSSDALFFNVCAGTFGALLFTGLGCMIYLLFTLVASSADMVIPTIPTPSFAPTVANVSSSLSIRPSTSVALVPQAYPPAILTAVSSDLDNIPPRTSSACNCHSSDRTKLSTDIISMPATASLALSSLSIRAALIDTVSRDLRELMDALDDLSRAIMRQTSHI